ncbi:MAG: NAD(P)H-hydrate dehydratase [Acidimicrobiia bacterium]|nr:NAD(P)H-hydrate dehydratase [Acidimicrobiia bacterium]
MLPVVTPAEMAAADRRAIDSGTTEAVLVERAGRAVAWEARRILGGCYGRRVVVVSGKGNNGADGEVAARVLVHWGARVEVVQIGARLDRDSVSRSVARSHLAIDAMFGTGLKGPLGGDAAWIAGELRSAGVPVLSVDIPSGVDGSTGRVAGLAVMATATTTFAALKPGLLFEPGRTHAGRVRVVGIGVEPSVGGELPPVRCTTSTDVSAVVAMNPRIRRADVHKWTAGVLIVGGSPGMTGAPLLAARAAARAGAGMVVAGVPGITAAAAASGTEVVVRALPAGVDGAFDDDAGRVVVRDLAGRFACIAVGPGLGPDHRAREAARRIVAEAQCPLVVDADGLNALAEDPAALRVRSAGGLPRPVLTPHVGEYERLAGEAVGDDRIAAAARLAESTRSVVLLKGPGTVVASPDGRVAVCPIGGPELASAGTGDVLTGIVAAFLAFGADGFEAAAAAAWLQAEAAATAGTGASLVAGDLVEALGPTLGGLSSH